MDALKFWQQKLVQFFHDPPAKVAAFHSKGGHHAWARDAFERFTQKKLEFTHRWPDLAASGADRPVLTPPTRTQGTAGVAIDWKRLPEITHPLAKHRQKLRAGDLNGLWVDLLDAQAEVAEGLSDLSRFPREDAWQNPDDLRQRFLVLWRRYCDDLESHTGETQLWKILPADSRCPDHAIWDHLRAATALAFLTKKNVPAAQEPWLLTFSIGPVGRFIAESRTSRDLWISSFLLSDLIWHAMQPLVERYGPDCVVYPDLRANPYVDSWLKRKGGILRDDDDPVTFAAVLPNTFTAILPRGGDGHLRDLAELAREAQVQVEARWRELCNVALEWMTEKAGAGSWQGIWDRQTKHMPLYTVWSAVPWQRPTSDRAARLQPWVPDAQWLQYEQAREVFDDTNSAYLNNERGFDYALTHHMLRTRHALRKAESPESGAPGEPGEKCTLCGRRQALTDGETNRSGGSVDADRGGTREFWGKVDEDQKGRERLCAVCAMKRYLIEADRKDLALLCDITESSDEEEP